MRVPKLSLGFILLTASLTVISFLPLIRPPLLLMIILLSIYVIILFAFCIIHGARTLGRTTIVVFFASSAAVTYIMEWLGTHYGVPFGSYYYTYKIGPLLFGVPLVIPIQWFNMLYICYMLSRAILARACVVGPARTQIVSSFVLALTTGLVMVAWDLINDPFMVAMGAWVWTDPAWFYGLMYQGIPITNYIGWEFTSLLAVLVFELYRARADIAVHWFDDRHKISNLLILIPYAMAYFSQAIQGVMFGVLPLESPTGQIPLIAAGATMGIISVLAGRNLMSVHEGQ